ncbi:hypothetical protein F4810DRAFT_72126 [Camillea tinctor]|nr:hypothetical protein F4810DRAFT_72126 [Camillea tinctor]
MDSCFLHFSFIENNTPSTPNIFPFFSCFLVSILKKPNNGHTLCTIYLTECITHTHTLPMPLSLYPPHPLRSCFEFFYFLPPPAPFFTFLVIMFLTHMPTYTVLFFLLKATQFIASARVSIFFYFFYCSYLSYNPNLASVGKLWRHASVQYVYVINMDEAKYPKDKGLDCCWCAIQIKGGNHRNEDRK